MYNLVQLDHMQYFPHVNKAHRYICIKGTCTECTTTVKLSRNTYCQYITCKTYNVHVATCIYLYIAGGADLPTQTQSKHVGNVTRVANIQKHVGNVTRVANIQNTL